MTLMQISNKNDYFSEIGFFKYINGCQVINGIKDNKDNLNSKLKRLEYLNDND